MNFSVMIFQPLHYHFYLVTRCSIRLENTQIITKLCLDCCKKLLLEVLIPLFIHGSVLGQNCERAHSLGWQATPHMDCIRMLHYWHDTGLVVMLTFSSEDKWFSKQSEGGFIRENKVAPVFCCPVLVPPAKYQSVLNVFLGKKCLLCFPSFYKAVVQKSSLHCACRCTCSHLMLILSKLCTVAI